MKDEISKQETQYHIFEDKLNQLRQESVQAKELANELKNSETELLESIRTLEPLVEQLKFCIKHQESIESYQKLIDQQEAYELKASRLQQLMDAYGNSLETPPTSSVQQIQEQIIKLQQQRSALKKSLTACNSGLVKRSLPRRDRRCYFPRSAPQGWNFTK